MTTINLNEFSNCTKTGIYKFLLSQQAKEFEIIIRKTYNPVDDESFIIFWEYHIMAYAGQKLFELSSGFSYFVPGAGSKQPFKFIAEINDLAKLADVLYDLAVVLQEDDPANATTGFQSAALSFFNDAYDGKVEAATWGLLTLANSFLS